MINKKLFYFFLALLALSAGFYAFKKYGPQRLYGTQYKIDIFCDDLFNQNAFSAADEIANEKCQAACAKLKMDFTEYDCKVGNNLVCSCR